MSNQIDCQDNIKQSQQSLIHTLSDKVSVLENKLTSVPVKISEDLIINSSSVAVSDTLNLNSAVSQNLPSNININNCFADSVFNNMKVFKGNTEEYHPYDFINSLNSLIDIYSDF